MLIRRLMIWLVAWLILGSGRSFAEGQTSAYPEYQLKAAVIYKLAAFIDWPPRRFADPNSPLVLGIVGEDPFGNELDKTFQGLSVRGHPVVLQRLRPTNEVTHCHVLFVGSMGLPERSKLLTDLQEMSVLTIGETEDFCDRGGMIQLIKGKTVAFEINQAAAERAKLAISSQVLRLAKRVVRATR